MENNNFLDIAYLAGGNELQRKAFAILTGHGIMDLLRDYEPLLVGTIPIDIAIPGSDLDIICCFKDAKEFETHLIKSFGKYQSFQLGKTLVNCIETIIASFTIEGQEIEVFGQTTPTTLQNGYRHMVVEQRLLAKYGEDLRLQIIELKNQGLKTEPAFARALNIEGDPYIELLKLFRLAGGNNNASSFKSTPDNPLLKASVTK